MKITRRHILSGTAALVISPRPSISRSAQPSELLSGKPLSSVGTEADRPVILEDFKQASDWVSRGGTLQTDTTPETASVTDASVLGSTGSGSFAVTTRSQVRLPIDLAEADVIAWYTEITEPWRTVRDSGISFGRDGRYNLNSNPFYNTPASLGGKFWEARHVSELDGLPTGRAPVDIRRRFTPKPGTELACRVETKSLIGRARGIPTFVFTMDDCESAAFDVVRPMLAPYAMKFTIHIPTAWVGRGGKLDWGQIGALHAEGHEIGLDGSSDDSIMMRKTSLAAALRDLEMQQMELMSNGLPRAVSGCYPNGLGGGDRDGAYPTDKYLGQVVANGSNTILAASPDGAKAGDTILGYRVPDGTIIESVDGRSLRLSAPIPALKRPMVAIDKTGEFYPGKLQAALKNAGFESFRLTPRGAGSNDMYVNAGIPSPMTLWGQGFTKMTAKDWPLVRADIDRAILRGTALIFYMHKVLPGGGSINTDQELLQLIVNYLGPLKISGKIDVLTQGQLAARYRGDRLPSLLAN